MWRWLAVMVIAVAVYAHFSNPHKGGLLGVLGFSSVDTASVRVAAQKVQPTDIVVFTTDWCPSCKKMKAWLDDYGFAYTECDVEKSKHCLDAWQAAGQRGVPYVVVKGQAYRDWWDAAALLDLLGIPVPTQQDKPN